MNVYLRRGREQRVLGGHPWIFRSDIEREDGAADGLPVRVLTSAGRFLAMAVYNPRSQISLRILSRRDEPIDAAFIRGRVRRALDYRRRFADLNSCRLIFAESDGLPAVIADKFGDVIVLQILCLGMERFKGDIVDALAQELSPRGVYERNDVPVRELEGLSQQTGLLFGEVPDRVEMQENGVRFLVDVKEGQKTGFFLDQKENRASLAPLVRGREVLDCFTHTGSFALHAAKYGASHVTGMDISEDACAIARRNAELNGLNNVEFVAENAFDLLRRSYDEKKHYDVIILDPPAFTKTRQALSGALRGYKEINLRAMKMLPKGGYLVTCSCSQHVSPEVFTDMLLDAARDAHRQLRLIESRTQGKDHPILLAAPETRYLKFMVFQVF